MSIMQEQKMIDESLLLRYFKQEVSEEEKKKVEEWIHSSEANSRMAKQVARIFVATRLLHGSKEASPQQALQNFWRQVERRKRKRIWRYIGKVAAILALPVLILTTIYWFSDNSDGNDAIVWMEARGNDSEVCTVLLPDSSTVYLNSQAKLKYPTHFAKERRVYLDGEAYFVVRKQMVNVSLFILFQRLKLKCWEQNLMSRLTGKEQVRHWLAGRLSLLAERLIKKKVLC